MRFIVDAHLPKRIASILVELGHEAIHTSELTEGNATSDREIIALAAEDGIVVSKDDDFYQSHILHGRPSKLVCVKVGNMRLREITALFIVIAPDLTRLLIQYDLLEVHRDKIVGLS